MSYCVKCGVELDATAEKCVLCSTPVINPVETEREKAVAPFADKVYMPKEVERRLVAAIISTVMAIPNVVCILLNIFLFKESPWAAYICSTSFLAWVAFVFPFFLRKVYPLVILAFDGVVLSLYLFLLNHLVGGKWFFDCALPIVAVNALLVLFYILWTHKKRHWVHKLLCIATLIAAAVLSDGIILDFGGGVKYALEFGVIVFCCVLAVVAFLGYCFMSKTVRAWLSERFFI